MKNNLYGKTVKFGANEWIIIDSTACGYLLMSCESVEYLWDGYYRIDDGKTIEWPNCELFEWLNDDFVKEIFSDEERACVVDCSGKVNRNNDNQVGVFVLSEKEYRAYSKKRASIDNETNSYDHNCWYRDSGEEMMFEHDEDAPLQWPHVFPAIWIDNYLVKEVGLHYDFDS